MLAAQWQANTGPAGAALGAIVGGDVERYLRAASLAGVIPQVPWAARPYGSRELKQFFLDSTVRAHPWRSELQRSLARRTATGTIGFSSINSAFPWGSNDGAIWQGRGINLAIGVAAAFHWGALSVVAAPLAYSSQNASFRLQRPIVAGVSPYADPLLPTAVDLPQRMGSRPYTRLDPGESSIRMRLKGAEIGVSSASEGWGTGEAFPAILGANAGGFPHLFFGASGRGVHLDGIGDFKARYVLGLLDQSAWSRVQGSETYRNSEESGTRRIGSGVSVGYSPSFLAGLEVGASRFFHSPYRAGRHGWNAWSKPFEGIFKQGFNGRTDDTGDPGGDSDNQLAAFFARWAFPRRGIEATIEVFRDDHSWDSRDFAQEPENNSAVLASIRTTVHRDADRLALLTFEYFDGDVRPIAQARAQAFLYAHTPLRQGHTQRGQLLGAPIGAGAIAGARSTWEQFTPTGSFRVNLQRWRTRSTPSTDPQGLLPAAGSAVPNSHDWILEASAAATRYRSRRTLSLEAGVAWAGRWQLSEAKTNFFTRASLGMF